MPIALLLEVPDLTVAKNAALEEVVWEGPTKNPSHSSFIPSRAWMSWVRCPKS